MNGRAYDYNLGRFLSVDPFVQSPGNSQSMNPYSYIMNNPLAGTDPSGYKFVSGSVDCIENGAVCSAILSGGIATANDYKTGYALTNGNEPNNNVTSGLISDKGTEHLLGESSKGLGILVIRPYDDSRPLRFSVSGDTDNRADAFEQEMSVMKEHEERMSELDDKFEASDRRVREAGDRAAERQNAERVERQQREIDTERRLASIRREEAKRNPVVPEFPFENINSAQGDAMIAVGVLSSPALIAASPSIISATVIASRVVASGAGAVVQNRKKIIRGCVLITSLCNNISEPTKKAGATDINRTSQIERIYRDGDAVRRLNEHLRNVPTQVK